MCGRSLPRGNETAGFGHPSFSILIFNSSSLAAWNFDLPKVQGWIPGFKCDQISQSCIQISLFSAVPSTTRGRYFQKSSLDAFFSEPDGFRNPLGVFLEQRVAIGITPIGSYVSQHRISLVGPA
jgi:hypothetical protein